MEVKSYFYTIWSTTFFIWSYQEELGIFRRKKEGMDSLVINMNIPLIWNLFYTNKLTAYETCWYKAYHSCNNYKLVILPNISIQYDNDASYIYNILLNESWHCTDNYTDNQHFDIVYYNQHEQNYKYKYWSWKRLIIKEHGLQYWWWVRQWYRRMKQENYLTLSYKY